MAGMRAALRRTMLEKPSGIARIDVHRAAFDSAFTPAKGMTLSQALTRRACYVRQPAFRSERRHA